MTTEERFLNKVIKTDYCWIWNAGFFKNGYGGFYFNNKTMKAHRVSYILHFGLFPDNLKILHKCDNPKCVNPDHLFLGTDKDNVYDMVAKGRNRNNNTGKTHCIHGHSFSGRNLITTKRGHRQCRTCIYNRTSKRRSKSKLQA